MDCSVNLKNIKGDIVIPPSKSLSHRAIIAACLAEGNSVIKNVILSQDIKATIKAMEALGSSVIIDNDTLYIKGSKPKRVMDCINCLESGSTVRFMIPIALTVDSKITFMGENHLVKRPLNVYLEILDEQNIRYEKGNDELPLTVYNSIKPGVFNIRGDISSQFITGLLYALPLLNGNSIINITTPLESVGYIDLTLDMLKKFGIEIKNNDYRSFEINGNQEYKPCDYYVEGDYSQSAFYLVAGALKGDINLVGMNKDSLQGDKAILKILDNMGVKYEFSDKIYVHKSNTKGCTIDLSQCPDLGPVLTVLATVSDGETRIINASRLRIKECDRITSMTTELNKLGANIVEVEDGMIIKGVKKLNGGTVDSWNDHRVAMSMAVASIIANDNIKIINAGCVKKSYPHFFEDCIKLNGDVKYE